MRTNKLKEMWNDNKISINAWLTIPNAWIAEIMAQIGFDSLTIDETKKLIEMGFKMVTPVNYTRLIQSGARKIL